MMVLVAARMALDDAALAALQAELGPLGMLHDVVRHVYARTPPGDIADVLVQDEFTHDVVVSLGDCWLVFDTT